ncbi:hypothetical protein M3G15_07615 [Paenibacillus sp. p3-SID1389]|uniref:hypothetical protein n=1 Tax=Paenibacillus sp. p3-SID1389 TaxID=2916364 RepID=UPI0021A3345A|nr:hypothetical protein [Paenibacillus sp. p3-SID1389]MCT2195004.1 hypothetical protein [Paenibacillus sp. p3-SID1389]
MNTEGSSFEAALFEVLYWFAMIAMSLVLAGITVALFLTGIKMARTTRKGLGIGCIVFSLAAACMVIMMVNRQFF